MPPLIGSRAIILGLLGGLLLTSPGSGATLKASGTGAVTALLIQLGPAFKADSGIDLDVVPGLGTSGANNAAADGKLGLAVSGRELRAKEQARGLKIAATYRTPFGLMTSRAGPDSLKSSEVVPLFRAAKPLWPDGTPVLLILRPVDESDNLVLAEAFPGMADAVAQARKRSDLSVAATDQDNADMSERVKGSLAGASLTQILTEKRNLRFVAIDGVMPSLENHLNGSYPYRKMLYMVVPSTVSPEAQAFIAFLAKPAGAALLRQAGVVAGK